METGIKPPTQWLVDNNFTSWATAMLHFQSCFSIFLSINLPLCSAPFLPIFSVFYSFLSPCSFISLSSDFSLCLFQCDTHLEGSCRLLQGASRSVGYSLGSGQRWRYRWDTQQTPLLLCNTAALHGLEEKRRQNRNRDGQKKGIIVWFQMTYHHVQSRCKWTPTNMSAC